MGQASAAPDSARALRASAILFAIFRLAGLWAQGCLVPGPLPSCEARCELSGSGLAALSLGAEVGDFAYRFKALSAPGGSASLPAPSALPALRASFRAGPLSVGSLLPPALVLRLEDPLSRPALPAIGPEKAAGPSLDPRDLPADARPGLQEEPGAALALEGGLVFPNRGGEEGIRLCAGFLPEGGRHRFGFCASYLFEAEGRGLGLDFAALLVPQGREPLESEESWYLDLVPDLPLGLPVAAGRGGIDLSWGPLSLSAGLRASNGRGPELPWYGEAGIAWEMGGFAAEFALASPLAAQPGRAPPLLAADGLPSGRREGAEAGILREWRWKGSWKGRRKGGPAWEAGAAYESRTGRPLASGRDFLPRREELGIEASLTRDSAGIRSSLRLGIARILDWRAEGGLEAEGRSEAEARIGFDLPRGGPSLDFTAGLALTARERGGSDGGEDALRLLLLSGTLSPRGTEMKRKAGIALRYRGIEAKAAVRCEGDGGLPAFSAKVDAKLGPGGSAFLEIGPGEEARLGWSGP